MHEEVRGQPQVSAVPFHLVAADSLWLLCCCAPYSMVLHQFLGNSLVSASHFSIEIFGLETHTTGPSLSPGFLGSKPRLPDFYANCFYPQSHLPRAGNLGCWERFIKCHSVLQSFISWALGFVLMEVGPRGTEELQGDNPYGKILPTTNPIYGINVSHPSAWMFSLEIWKLRGFFKSTSKT